MRAVVVVAIVAACSDPAVSDYDAAVRHFEDVACTGECVVDEAACRADLAADFMDAATMLPDDDARAQCAHCLDVKAQLVPDVVACTPTAEQNAEVYAACDLDATMDFDRDGDPADDDDQACAGFP